MKNFSQKLRQSKAVFMSVALAVVVFATGCGKQQNIVKDVQLKTFTVGSDEWVQVSTTMDTGGFRMAALNLPIGDPRNPSKVYGNVSTATSFCAGCRNGLVITVALNATEASMGHTLDPVLPNGTALPVGVGNATVIALPLVTTNVSNARIYFAFGQGVAMLGAALTFAAFDPVGNYVPNINLFIPFSAGGVNMNAGFFTGTATNTTGLGFFVDLASVMPHMGAIARSAELGMNSSGAMIPSRLVIKSVSPSGMKKLKLGMKLDQMANKGTVLELK